jgi:S1-C subfamily serine protease
MTTASIESLSDSLSSLAERAATHLVRIRQRRRRGLTGVLYAEGLLVTSSRGLRSDTDIEGAVGDVTFDLELVGRDPGRDVALLRFDPPSDLNLIAPTWRTDAPKVGELVFALARPGQTVRAALGVLSVVGGPFSSHGGTQIDHYLELDRDLPRGFTGGLLLDAAGRGIGINVPGVFRGVTVTLPSTTLAEVVGKLQQHGHVPRGYLGVGVSTARLPGDIADDVGQSRGVAVVALEENGPAATAGIGVGDIIISIDAQSITSPMSLRSRLLDRGGDTINLRVLRAGQTEDLNVSVGTRA